MNKAIGDLINVAHTPVSLAFSSQDAPFILCSCGDIIASAVGTGQLAYGDHLRGERTAIATEAAKEVEVVDPAP